VALSICSMTFTILRTADDSAEDLIKTVYAAEIDDVYPKNKTAPQKILYPHDTLSSGYIPINSSIDSQNDCVQQIKQKIKDTISLYKTFISLPPTTYSSSNKNMALQLNKKEKEARERYKSVIDQGEEYLTNLSEKNVPTKYFVNEEYKNSKPIMSAFGDTIRNVIGSIEDTMIFEPTNIQKLIATRYLLKIIEDLRKEYKIYLPNDIKGLLEETKYLGNLIPEKKRHRQEGNYLHATSCCEGLWPIVYASQAYPLIIPKPSDSDTACCATQLWNEEGGRFSADNEAVDIHCSYGKHTVSQIDYSPFFIAYTSKNTISIERLPLRKRKYEIAISERDNKETLDAEKTLSCDNKKKPSFSVTVIKQKKQSVALITNQTIASQVNLLIVHPTEPYALYQAKNLSWGNSLYKLACQQGAQPECIHPNTDFKKLLFLNRGTCIGLTNKGKLQVGYFTTPTAMKFIPQKHALIFQEIATEHNAPYEYTLVALLAKEGNLYIAEPFGKRGKNENIILHKQDYLLPEDASVKNMYMHDLAVIIHYYANRSDHYAWIVPNIQ
jgi:hypothetical protein